MSQTMTLEAYLDGAQNLTANSKWFEVSQDLINTFADATHDHQFIHVDPERAKAETPFGGTIAHGFLSLSLLSAFAIDCLPSIEGTAMGINYGFEKVRFLMPVPAGAKVRGVFDLKSAEMRKPGELQRIYNVTVEIEGVEKPALIAEWITLAILENKEA